MPRNKEKQKIKQHESYLRNKEKYLERQKEIKIETLFLKLKKNLSALFVGRIDSSA